MGDDFPDYEQLEAWIRQAPQTFLPAMLAATIESCIRKNVFKEGGMEIFVERVRLREANNGR